MSDWLFGSAGLSLSVQSVVSFLLISLALAGAGAYATGRALALVWQPFRLAILYVIFLTAGERFLHFALFHEPLWAPAACALDYALSLAIAALAYYRKRAQQMVRQYGFLLLNADQLSEDAD